MKKKILIAIFVVLCVVGAVCAIYFPNSNINNEIAEAQNAVIEEIENAESTDVIVSDEAQEIVEETIEAAENGEDLSTTEIIESSEDEEEAIEEEATEEDGAVEQENIAWERRYYRRWIKPIRYIFRINILLTSR